MIVKETKCELQRDNVSWSGTAQVIELTPEELDGTHLRDLAHGRCSVLHVRGFVAPEVCTVISTGALKHGYRAYLNVPSVRRIGMAFYETENKPELVQTYFDVAKENLEKLRSACAPMMSPLDMLRCKLDEVWKAGAHLQTINGKKMFVGLSRMVEPGTTFLAHHDIFEQDAPGIPEATSVKAQFGANIYVRIPKNGGELLMWNMNMNPKTFDHLRGKDYGLRVESLPPPDIVVKPHTGDLLIFDAKKMHAVAPPIEHSRLALSCFVAYRGDDQPLTYWS